MRFKDGKGERQTDFFTVITWRGLADNCAKYLNKGSQIAIAGEIQNRSYEKDGAKHYVTEIHADDIQFLTPKKEETKGGFREIENEVLPWE